MNELQSLADSWVNTDTAAIRQDVERLGSVDVAAEYSSQMSIGQGHWEALSTPAGVEALRKAITDVIAR